MIESSLENDSLPRQARRTNTKLRANPKRPRFCAFQLDLIEPNADLKTHKRTTHLIVLDLRQEAFVRPRKIKVVQLRFARGVRIAHPAETLRTLRKPAAATTTTTSITITTTTSIAVPFCEFEFPSSSPSQSR
jgi:hypothetical protein